MPKGEPTEEELKRLLAQQKEAIKKIQARGREKLQKVKARLAKEKNARQLKAAGEIEAVYRANPVAIDTAKIKAICEKYWPVVKEAQDTAITRGILRGKRFSLASVDIPRQASCPHGSR